jgi:hypothetical protein
MWRAVSRDLSLWRASDTFSAMTQRIAMYERPRLERYGTFRDLTQVSLNLGAFAMNSSVVNGTVASCDCLPTENPPGGGGTRS